MILDEILFHRKKQLEKEKQLINEQEMQERAKNAKHVILPFESTLKNNSFSIIAEVKKASPSKGVIATHFTPVEFAKEYQEGGAAAISCLTEEHFFQGSLSYLEQIRSQVSIPILRKDFLFEKYQIDESRSAGADIILLIVAALKPTELKELYEYASSLGLYCIVEVHNEEELEQALKINAKIIGINNRNLHTFNVSLKTTKKLIELVPKTCLTISESGLSHTDDLLEVKSYGAKGALIGEQLMRTDNKVAALQAMKRALE